MLPKIMTTTFPFKYTCCNKDFLMHEKICYVGKQRLGIYRYISCNITVCPSQLIELLIITLSSILNQFT